MLRIQRCATDATVLTVSGQIGVDDLTELQQILSREQNQGLALDLRELKRIDADGIRFLILCEARGIRVEHCAPYIREWMLKEGQ
jgi:ABC-type transporter Mla MlaB component